MSFATLALICLVALVGPLFAVPRHGGLPVVIGELLVGLVLGQTGLQALDATNETFSFMAQIGFALVMFILCFMPVPMEMLDVMRPSL